MIVEVRYLSRSTGILHIVFRGSISSYIVCDDRKKLELDLLRFEQKPAGIIILLFDCGIFSRFE